MTLVYILIFFICSIPDNNKTMGLQFNATDDFECLSLYLYRFSVPLHMVV